MSVITRNNQGGVFQYDHYCAIFGAVSISEEICRVWNNTGMFDTSISGAVTQLMRLYEFRSESGLRESLVSDPYLVMGLALAADAIRQYFLDAQLALDLYKDREDPDCEILALRILTHLRYPASRELLCRFRKEWWAQHLTESIRDKITLGVESV